MNSIKQQLEDVKATIKAIEEELANSDEVVKDKFYYASQIPVDTLVKVWDGDNNKWCLGYFSRVKDEDFLTFSEGSTSKTNLLCSSWGGMSIAEGDWVFWRGGEQPVPNWMKIRVITLNDLKQNCAKDFQGHVSNPRYLSWDATNNPIVAYKILEQEIPSDV